MSKTKPKITPAFVEAALDLRHPEQSELANEILDAAYPAILATIRDHAYRHRLDRRQLAEDLIQDFMVQLWQNDAQVLRAWDPIRGRGFRSWISLLARRYVFRSLRKTIEHNSCYFPTYTDTVAFHPTLDYDARSLTTSYHMLEKIQNFVSNRGDLVLFEYLFLEQEEPRVVAQALGMTIGAIYTWKSRFIVQARQRFGQPLVSVFWSLDIDWSHRGNVLPIELVHPKLNDQSLKVSVDINNFSVNSENLDSLFLGALTTSLLYEPLHWPATTALITLRKFPERTSVLSKRRFCYNDLSAFLRQMVQKT